jgi:hypothetical protein
MVNDLFDLKGALLSECCNHRYSLYRIWDIEKPYILFIMLNPSTADHFNDDPTIRRCINFAKDWGYGGLFVGNLFSYRATNPNELKELTDDKIIGIDNDVQLAAMASKCEKVVFAWGDIDKRFTYREAKVISMFKGSFCIALSKSNHPRHPLYLRSDTRLIPFDGDFFNIN